MASLNAVGRFNEELKELECPVCKDLFNFATSLNCSHTYCETCITQWLRMDNHCPVCRTAVTAKVRSLAVDNYIRKVRGRLSIKRLSTNQANWQRSGRKRNRRRRRRNRNKGINQQTTATQRHQAFQSTPQRTQSQGVFPYRHQRYHENMNYNRQNTINCNTAEYHGDRSGSCYDDGEYYDEEDGSSDDGDEQYDDEGEEQGGEGEEYDDEGEYDDDGEEHDEGSEEYDDEEEEYDDGSEEYDSEEEECGEEYDDEEEHCSEEYDDEEEECDEDSKEYDDEEEDSDDESDKY